MPVDFTLESGDEFAVFASAEGVRPDIDFDISDGAVVAAGDYEWVRYGGSFSTATKRAVTGSFGWNGGDFYDGHLDQFEASARAFLGPLVTVEANGEWNRGRVGGQDFSTDLYGVEVQFTFSPDLTWTTFAQFDTESDSLGVNTRLRWDVTPTARLFVVYNADATDPFDRWRTQRQAGTVKMQFEVRF